jgi:hypothetical protein
MKNISTAKPVSVDELEKLLNENLNPLFHNQRKSDVSFDIVKEDNTIEIINTEFYDGFLFQIEIEGNQIHVIKSEHYTDDVNVLTLEEILNGLFLEFPGRRNIKNIEDES